MEQQNGQLLILNSLISNPRLNYTRHQVQKAYKAMSTTAQSRINLGFSITL